MGVFSLMQAKFVTYTLHNIVQHLNKILNLILQKKGPPKEQQQQMTSIHGVFVEEPNPMT